MSLSAAKSALRRSAVARAAASALSAAAAPARSVSYAAGPQFACVKGEKKTLHAATAEEALKPFLKSGQNIHLHQAASTPTELMRGMVAMQDQLDDMRIYHMSLDGPPVHLDASIPQGKFTSKAMFVSANIRPHLASGRAEFIPVFFSEAPLLYRSGRVPLDVAMITVSPPDAHGWCSLGVSTECAVAAVQTAKHVIAQINPTQPRTHGDGLIHMSAIDACIHTDTPIYTGTLPEMEEVDKKIGQFCAQLIPDGACLQLGIGAIPNAVLSQLGGHKNLGIHSELFSDGVLPLVKSGVINNSRKQIYANHLVGTFLTGTRALFDYVDDNPEVLMLDVATVNNPSIIGMNDNVMAINSAIEIDLTGQVCADSIGSRIYSGIGGQMDFMRGAALSKGGKPIIAMPSTTAKGQSKITPALASGAGVVTTRGHLHYVVTEYGIAELFGKTLQQRAVNLANVAHPDHRDALFKTIRERYGKTQF